MYYTNGNYAAFAKPLKPAGIENKHAYLIGGGLAALSAAAFLIRDGQMSGKNICILEEAALPGGGCDGIKDPNRGYVIRGGREMEDHFECLWDLYRSIPSLEIENASVLDEFYWLNQADPSSSPVRVTENQGKDAHTLHKFALSDTAAMEISTLIMTPEKYLDDKRITDVFGKDFFESNFWLFWRSMFAFEEWHSAIEMRRYLTRFIHLTHTLPDLSGLKFTKFNQYESLILPLVKFLESHGVNFRYETTVTNVIFDIQHDKKVAKQIDCISQDSCDSIKLTENDFVFITLGSNTDQSGFGDDNHPVVVPEGLGSSWSLWKNIAAQDEAFGHPGKFCGDVSGSNWESATITFADDKIPAYIEKLTGRDPYNGKIVTGGPITAKDSSWLMSWTVSRQPHFKVQKSNEIVAWVYGLFSNKPGDFIKKPMQACTGLEIVEEWLYHIGVPVNEIPDLAKNHAHCIPCMMPYVTSYFMVRKAGDRPNIVPDHALNFAFIGEHVETPEDTVFTTEYAVRTGMEAVYTLLNIGRGVPEVFASAYDIRILLKAAASMLDGKKLTDLHLPLEKKLELKKITKQVRGTMLEELLKEHGLV
ncbi:oleate hydratase [Acetobacterium woodii]|uniref:67 kDa myosin-cross-reactive antigen family protein n=1 Tax=Acetobacterium woodii (strain ATCC 29683 / DSM 1030 / JCM 2381 / KCTC 1655 / WB1) TaxID=931626 RepID=H6LL00_ACEWD|nr:oleate hydratase [Acetobacterium woodii]AFA50109.1 67 kDa myosin-cross-reactive antigen family protein [Acetobacterium woodii DSM 1030]